MAASATAAFAANQLDAIAFNTKLSEIHDQVYGNIPIIQRLYDKDKVGYRAGSTIELPVNLTDPGGTAWMEMYDTIDTTPADTLRSAVWVMKKLRRAITISDDELTQAMSDPREIVSLVDARSAIEIDNIRNQLEASVFSDGSATSQKELQGLKLAVDDGTVGSINYGGLSRTTYTNWKGNIDTTSAAVSFSALETAFVNAVFGPWSPTVAVTTKARYATYAGLVAPSQRIADDKVGYSGFSSGISFNGIPVLHSGQVTASHWYFLCEDVIELIVQEDRDLKVGDFQEVINQDAYSKKIRWNGALIVKQPRANSKLTALAA